MYTVRARLHLSESEERFLSKCFFIMNTAHNKLVRYAQDRLNTLFDDKEYTGARNTYSKAGFSGKSKEQLSKDDARLRKQLTDIMYAKQAEYGIRKTDLEKYIKVLQHKYANYISSHQAQAEVNAVMEGINKVLYSDGKQLHYKRFNQFDCIKQKNSTNGVFVMSWHEIRFMRHVYRTSFTDNDYIRQVIANTNLSTDVVYSSLKRIEFDSGFRYYVTITLRGSAPKKLVKCDHKNRTGIDFGTSTIATASDDEVNLIELAPMSGEYEKQIRHLQNLVSHSMRVHNPDNYNENGTVRKGRHQWVVTKRCRRMKRKIRVLFRKQSAYIMTTHHAFINHLIETSSEIITEPMNFKQLQKKSKTTERSDKVSTVKVKDGPEKQIHKYKRKKRFGHSIKNRSPGLMQSTLKQKAEQYDIPYFEIDRNRYRASQLHHDTGEYIRSDLSERMKIISGHKVQRDLYSAFLISNTDDSLTEPDFKKCIAKFEHFVEMHDSKLAEMRADGITNRPCFGF